MGFPKISSQSKEGDGSALTAGGLSDSELIREYKFAVLEPNHESAGYAERLRREMNRRGVTP